MLTVRLPASFAPERIYILDVLLGERLGLQYQLLCENRSDYELSLPNGHRLTLADTFFGSCDESEGYLQVTQVPSKIRHLDSPLALEPDVPIIYGTEEIAITETHIHMGADIVAGAFFLLTRWEETLYPALHDEHGRVPAESTLACRAGFLQRPVVDEYVELLWHALQHLGISQPRREVAFKLVPTHDIDQHLFYNTPLKAVWVALHQWAGSKRYAPYVPALTHTQHTSTPRNPDPYNTYSYLMQLAEEAGTQAYFFFKATRHNNRYEHSYGLTSDFIQKLFAEINRRRHHIGFHAGYHTHLNPEAFAVELDCLRKAAEQAGVKQPVAAGRQHFLRFEVPGTWECWDSQNLVWSSTAGHATQPGFRCGTCHSFPVFNAITRQKLQLRERPLLIMETSLFQNNEQIVHTDILSVEAFRKAWLALRATVQRYKGEFVFNWHNNTLLTPRWQPYADVLRDVMLG